jgi:hypothetical protein
LVGHGDAGVADASKLGTELRCGDIRIAAG